MRGRGSENMVKKEENNFSEVPEKNGLFVDRQCNKADAISIICFVF